MKSWSLLASLLVVACITGCITLSGQDGTQPATVIRTEKKLVLVDVVVTDKKGDYVHGLTAKDFKLWEDKDEQTIESFSAESDPASGLANRKHYLVLFFDNSSMQLGEQTQARQAALKFLDKNAGPNRLMAVVNFGGSLHIAQNFTSDTERLKQVISGVKLSSVASNTDVAGGQALSKAETDFGSRTVLLGLRSLAKNLATVPGRKTLIFLSAGFKLDSELRSELTAVVDVCNKSNVAIYPIDTRGLVAAAAGGQGTLRFGQASGHYVLVPAAYLQQRAGGGSPASPTGSKGGSGGAAAPIRTGSGNTGVTRSPINNSGLNPNNSVGQPRSIIPHMPDINSQQDVLYALAQGTGGFVIVNTNDLLGGLDRIANELNEYYVLGYSPADDEPDGSCHELRVKLDKGGTNVRSRTGYCSTKPVDLLAGTVKGKDLENRAAGSAAGTVAAKMQTAYFYKADNTARVDVAMEMPADTLKFKKDKGKLHAEMDVLGVAYNSDGGVAAKFSDTLKLEFDNKKEVEQFEEKPLRYEGQFDLASGKYNLKVVFSAAGQGFGKMESPLLVDAYDSQKFSMSGVALSSEMHKVNALDSNLDAALLADKTPMIVGGIEMTPTASNVFRTDGPGAFYLEIYAPSLVEDKPHKVALQMVIFDRKTNQQKIKSGNLDMMQYAHAGSPLIPVGLRIPAKELSAGSYRAEFQAADDAGHLTVVKSANFDVQ